MKTIDDFLSDETFRAWTRAGGLRQTNAYWSRWWYDHPGQQALMREAQNILLAAYLTEEAISPSQTEQFVEQTIGKIRERQPIHPKHGVDADARNGYSRWIRFAVVGILVLVGGFVGWTTLFRSQTAGNQLLPRQLLTGGQNVRHIHNENRTPQLITLADGSTVLLQPNAQLTFPHHFVAKNREVELKGEAFFRITKRPEQPFLVLANGMVTKVLGTSFHVRANDGSSTVTVEVKTGRVAVFALADLESERQSPKLSTRSVLVTPNQQVVFERETGQINRSLIAEPALLVIPERNRDFAFTDAPVSQVLTTLETAYGVDIVFDDTALQRCTLTAPLGHEPLFDKLNVICRAIGGRYEVVGAQIVVQAEGCVD